MNKQTSVNHLKKKHLGYLGGPILFTAPHSKRLLRGGPQFNEAERIHYRQLYTSWIAVQLASLTRLNKKGEANSFMIWGKSSKVEETDTDPNYLLESMFSTNQFHLSLHAWALKNQSLPILHVDIHGKLNRKNNCEVDVGIKSMQYHWQKYEDPLVKYFAPYFEEQFAQIFEDMSFLGFKCQFNTNPCLHGFWGDKMCTMTEQAIQLGIPSFQLQIPLEVRKSLFKNKELMQKFSEGISKFYQKIIIPYYKQKTHPLKISKKLALKFNKTMKNEEIEESLAQIKAMEEKYELDFNCKKI